MIGFLISENVEAQSIRFPWNGYGHDSQRGGHWELGNEGLRDLELLTYL